MILYAGESSSWVQVIIICLPVEGPCCCECVQCIMHSLWHAAHGFTFKSSCCYVCACDHASTTCDASRYMATFAVISCKRDRLYIYVYTNNTVHVFMIHLMTCILTLHWPFNRSMFLLKWWLRLSTSSNGLPRIFTRCCEVKLILYIYPFSEDILQNKYW